MQDIKTQRGGAWQVRILVRKRCFVTHCITIYATIVWANMMHAADVEDAGMANVYTDISRGIDKQLWNLEAPLHWSLVSRFWS
jgi:hypothetical protein